MDDAVMETQLPHLPLFRRGKVRDTYDLGDRLLMIATDRISAFDVIMPTPIPRKGIVLTQLSRFWFGQIGDLMPNHLITADPAEIAAQIGPEGDRYAGRAMVVRKAERIDIECVVRGYLAGSGWVEYRDHGTVAEERHPAGMVQAQKLAEPIFTPAMKMESGHDVNISKATMANQVGADLARQLEEASIAVYQFAAEYAARHRIIIADTKFEFGFIDGKLSLIDEVLTPDSSRFWDSDLYEPGHDQPSFDKQFVRDWLLQSGWDRNPPGPELPPEVVTGTAERYHEAYRRLTGSRLWPAIQE